MEISGDTLLNVIFNVKYACLQTLHVKIFKTEQHRLYKVDGSHTTFLVPEKSSSVVHQCVHLLAFHHDED